MTTAEKLFKVTLRLADIERVQAIADGAEALLERAGCNPQGIQEDLEWVSQFCEDLKLFGRVVNDDR